MRIEMKAACAAALLVAWSPAAFAASLSGQPFPLDPTAPSDLVYMSAYDSGGGAFGVVLSESATTTSPPSAVYLQLFDAKGKRDGKKALVFQSAGLGLAGGVIPSGALPLSNGKTLVSYFDPRAAQSGFVSGMYAQAMSAKNKPSGKELTIAQTQPNQFAYGFLLPLSDGRGFAYWTASNGQTANDSKGKFVSTDGKLGPVDIDLSRKKSQFTGATPYLTGFIGQYATYAKDLSKASVYAQIFDADGKKTGKEATLEENGAFNDAVNTSAIGLEDGSIVVIRSVAFKKGAKLTAQLHDGNWNPVGKQKVLYNDLVEQHYVAHPLAGGDFILGVKVKDGTKDVALEYSRFRPSLKQSGASARIAGVKKPDFMWLLELENGNVFAAYASNGKQLTGQLIKP
ncbi:MAG: hypothetical protein DI565_06495 [Ancylobacter novellus]|uniref:Phytase-like domain-containing protein n=1 Tax=Ancylobacter novellus TaxID=921 RepID=A0A2W5KLV4_ANCNO|nr:MAG: hypothetical protein DI565_06495 [Ancylobacter novellus]